MPAGRKRLGRYELIEELAIGGMAELHLARMEGAHGFHRRVVIKRILPHLAADPEFVSMFIDEARITSHLSHPKIAQVLELGTLAKTTSGKSELFIVMEYVEGIDALKLLVRCKNANLEIPPPVAVYICREVLDALHFAHNAVETTDSADDSNPNGDASSGHLQIVHRDVSPGNVLISRSGNIKLTDFGIAHARVRQSETQAGTLKGKYAYMSPELVLERHVDHRSDQFSASVMLAEMLIGHRLFVASSDLELLLSVREVRLERLEKYGEHIPPKLLSILHRGLQRDPEQRFPDAGAYRDALSNWLYSSGARVTAEDVARFANAVTERARAVESEANRPRCHARQHNEWTHHGQKQT